MPNYLDNFDLIDSNNNAINIKLQDRDTLALATKVNAQLLHTKIQNVLDFGATGDGITDDTTAILNAFDAGDVIYFPVGNYVFNGSLEISNKTIIGCSMSDNVAPVDKGSTIVITQTANTPFIIGNAVTIIGLGFYYPNQNGSLASPVVYQPTILLDNCINSIITFCTFYNSYIAIDTDANSANGRIVISNNFIYGVHIGIRLREIYDSVNLQGNFITYGVFQDVAITGNAYLAKYTANNGFGVVFDGHVDDVKIIDNLLYGYFVGFQGEDDANVALNMIKIINNQLDGIQVMFALNNGTINNSIIKGNNIMQVNRFYTGTPLNNIIINGNGITPLRICDNSFELVASAIECVNRAPSSIIFVNNDVHTQGNIGVVGRLSFWVISNNIINTNNVQYSQGIILLSGSYHSVNGNIIIADIGIDITDSLGVAITGNMCIGDTKYRFTNVTPYLAGNNFELEPTP